MSATEKPTVYLDMCCLKRPFDDQTQPRIAVETTAVLAILQAVADNRLNAVRSVAHALENECNPDARRAAAVSAWLDELNPLEPAQPTLRRLVPKLTAVGLRPFDAYHLAWAEYLNATVLITCDDRFLAASERGQDLVKVRVAGPLAFVEEYLR